MIRKLSLIAMLLALLAPVQALAGDVVATYEYQNGNLMTVCVRDAQHVRIDTSSTSYTLLKGDKVYAVSQSDGQWQVVDMDQMKGAGSGFMSMFGGGDDDSAMTVTYTKTGRTEKVAGYTGVVYESEMREGGKVARRDEVVLSSHSDLKKLNEGWSALATRMGEIMGGDISEAVGQLSAAAKEKDYGGMLRFGDEMKLKSLKKPSLKSAYYELPSGAAQVQTGYQQQQDSGVSNELGQDAEDVGRAAKDEAKQSTIDGVREGVRGMFDSIFQ